MFKNKQNKTFLVVISLAIVLAIWLGGFGEQLLALRFLSPPPVPSSSSSNCTSPPTLPSNIKVSDYGNGQVLITWTDQSNDEYGFEIWRSLDKNNFNDLTGTVTENIANYIDEDANHRAFWYQIRAWNGCGSSQFTIPARLYIPPPPTSTSTPIPTKEPTVTSLPINTITPDSEPTPEFIKPASSIDSTIPFIIPTGIINARTGPGSEYEVAQTLEVDVKIEILGRVKDGTWIKVICSDAAIRSECWIPNDPVFFEVNNLDNAPEISFDENQIQETNTPIQTQISEPTDLPEVKDTPDLTNAPTPINKNEATSICPGTSLIIGLFVFLGFIGNWPWSKERNKKSRNQ